MELLLILFVLILLPTAFVSTAIKPYTDGTKFIDRTKYPTLARAQRIHRSSNTRKREIEAKATLNRHESKTLSIEDKAIEASENNVRNVRDMHDDSINEWDMQFSDITREEDERKRREAEVLAAEKKAKELAIWTANEKIRIRQFMDDQKAAQEKEAQRVADLMAEREKAIHSLSKHHVGGAFNEANKHLNVNVHGLYVRSLPTKDSRIIDNLEQNSWCTVNGWISYESLYGNPIWFRLANGQGWVWSGGLHSQATTGLENLNSWKNDGDTFVTKSADGMICNEFTTPSRLQELIDREIAQLKREKEMLSLEMRGDSPWEMRSASKIVTGSISGDTMSISPNGMSVTRNGETVSSHYYSDASLQKRAKRGVLSVPREDRYQLFSDTGAAQPYQPLGHTSGRGASALNPDQRREKEREPAIVKNYQEDRKNTTQKG